MPRAFSNTPQSSSQVFVPPVVSPVKKTPSVREVLQDPVDETKTITKTKTDVGVGAETVTGVQGQSEGGIGTKTITKTKTDGGVGAEIVTGVQGQSEGGIGTKTITKTKTDVGVGAETGVQEQSGEGTKTITKTTADVGTEDGEQAVEGASSGTDEKFIQVWKTMFELVYGKTATVYYPLKDTIPQREGNNIILPVKNELMKSNFEENVRMALSYLRNNYDPKIDNLEARVVVVEEKQKFVYGTQDQMNDLYAENADLPEFLKILNLSAKEI